MLPPIQNPSRDDSCAIQCQQTVSINFRRSSPLSSSCVTLFEELMSINQTASRRLIGEDAYFLPKTVNVSTASASSSCVSHLCHHPTWHLPGTHQPDSSREKAHGKNVISFPILSMSAKSAHSKANLLLGQVLVHQTEVWLNTLHHEKVPVHRRAKKKSHPLEKGASP